MDSLDDLLKEAVAIDLENRRGRGSILRLAAIRAACHSSWSNPDNWRASRLVALIHFETGDTLGHFQEWLHVRSTARRLTPIAQSAGQLFEAEWVWGAVWMGPLQHIVDPPTEGELASVRAWWRPHVYRPAWKHLKGVRQHVNRKTADELLGEL